MNHLIPKTLDLFVRWLLSAPGHEKFLVHFLNAVHDDAGLPHIHKVEVKTPFQFPARFDEKVTVLDVSAMDDAGQLYDVEIQAENHSSYTSRALLYWCRLYQGQIPPGGPYISLNPAEGIHLLDFTLFPDISKKHSQFHITEQDHPELVLTSDLGLHFIEMPKYSFDQDHAPENDLEKWVLWFTFKEEAQNAMISDIWIPSVLRDDPIYLEMEQKYHEFMSDEQFKYWALSREKFLRDQISWEYEARGKGLAEGRAQGITEGIAQGIDQGRAEGERTKAIETARRLFSRGMTIAEIAEITGLSQDDILKV